MTEITPATINFTLGNGLAIYQGATWNVDVRLFNRDNLEDTPFDLTGFTGKCSIKKCAGDDAAIAMPEVKVINAEDGTFELSLAADQTAKFICNGCTSRDVATFVYDVYLMKGSESYRAMMGNVEVSPSVYESDDPE